MPDCTNEQECVDSRRAGEQDGKCSGCKACSGLMGSRCLVCIESLDQWTLLTIMSIRIHI